jgi:hypothetical protein
MTITKKLTSLLLAGALSLGIAGKMKADLIDTFDSPPQGWITHGGDGDPKSAWDWSIFENKGVMRYDFYGGDSTSISITDTLSNSFRLSWDAYVCPFENGNTDYAGIDFCLHADSDSVIEPKINVGIAKTDFSQPDYYIYIGRTGTVVSDITNKWIHFDLTYNNNELSLKSPYEYTFNIYFDNVSLTSIPEPSSLELLVLGTLAGAGVYSLKRSRKD